jgi:hypothetical protein
MANLDDEATAHAIGYTTSSTGHSYKSGEGRTILDKLKVGETHNFLLPANDGIPPSHRKVAEESKYCRTFVKKVLDELQEHSHVIDPKVHLESAQSS